MAALTAASAALAGSAALSSFSRVSSNYNLKSVAHVRSSSVQRWQGPSYRALHVASVATTKELDLKLENEHVEDSEEDETKDKVEEDEDDESLIPNAFEIQSLLMELCDETSVAELEIKVGSFKLHVRRSVGGKAGRSPIDVPVTAPPVPSKPMIESIPIPVAEAPKPAPKRVVEDSDDEDADEGLAYISAPKVGIFRRGRFVKGKRGKPMVTEGSEVKKGQVIGYLEQLGTQLAIEADQAGEVVKVVAEDGDPVGFSEPLLAIRPSFPGIKKLT